MITPIVIIESPYGDPDPEKVRQNINYLRHCLRDSLLRGEAPFASHAIYTLPGVLDDTIPSEREHGINAGFAFHRLAQRTAVYTDRGISTGMVMGIESARKNNVPIEYRSLLSDKF